MYSFITRVRGGVAKPFLSFQRFYTSEPYPKRQPFQPSPTQPSNPPPTIHTHPHLSSVQAHPSSIQAAWASTTTATTSTTAAASSIASSRHPSTARGSRQHQAALPGLHRDVYRTSAGPVLRNTRCHNMQARKCRNRLGRSFTKWHSKNHRGWNSRVWINRMFCASRPHGGSDAGAGADGRRFTGLEG